MATPPIEACHDGRMQPSKGPSIPAGARAEPWVIIDGDCAFCTSSTTWLGSRLSRRDRLDARRVPYQFLDLESFGLTEERARQEMIWVPAGEVPTRLDGGPVAFARWLEYAGLPYAILGRIIDAPPVRPLARLVYRWVAAHRHQLPGGTPACALPPQGR